MTRHCLHRLGLACLLLAGPAATVAAEPLRLGDGDRILVLTPHPDDETLAAGGLIQEALDLDLPVRVCFFTLGDNNEIALLFTRRHPVMMPGTVRSTGTLRQSEAYAAASQLGLSTNDLVFLGYPDCGTLIIWNLHWRTVRPYRSMFTRATAVPYAKVLTPGSAHAGEDILDDLKEVIRDFRPTLVVVSHPADHNADHRALSLFTRAALWELESEGLSPKILVAPVHFTQWPKPRRQQPGSPAAPPDFLDGQTNWMEFALATYQATNKRVALRRYHSQYQQSSAYLDSFVRKSELFDVWPDILMPGGSGSARIEEADATQFRPDAEFFQEFARESELWNAIAEQNASEAVTLAKDDNDFTAHTISGDGASLTLSFQFLRPLSPAVSLTVAIFGFRAGTPFGEMPKITVEATPRELVAVKDLQEKLADHPVELAPGSDHEITLRIPFAWLGNPDRILTGAKLWKGRLPVDWVAWQAIALSGTAAPAAGKSAQAPSSASPPTLAPSPLPPPTLAPRVTLPRKSVPDRTPANEPVFW